MYGAVLVESMRLPLGKISTEISTKDLTAPGGGDYLTFSLPEDVFFIREELGILAINIDEEPYHFDEAIRDLYDFKKLVTNYWQHGETYFHVDANDRVIRSNGEPCGLRYVPLPVEPTAENYDELEVPLPPGETDRLIQLTAQHIESVLNGNQSKSAVHNALAQLYGVNYA